MSSTAALAALLALSALAPACAAPDVQPATQHKASAKNASTAVDGRFTKPAYLGRAGAQRPVASPLTLEELDLLRATLLLGEDDIAALRASRAVLEPHVDELLDVWYGFVGSNPHLLASFSGPDGPDGRYLAAVRERFGLWVLDTADARFDREWLDYQYEIGLRHHRTKKNRTDGVEAARQVPFRYLVALVSPISLTLRPFLERGEHSPAEVERMQQAWFKAVLLQAILWSQPYVAESDY